MEMSRSLWEHLRQSDNSLYQKYISLTCLRLSKVEMKDAQCFGAKVVKGQSKKNKVLRDWFQPALPSTSGEKSKDNS